MLLLDYLIVQDVYKRQALNDTARLTDHITCHVKYGKRDIERIADQRHRDKCLKHPLEKDPGFKVREIVVRDDELDQLVAGDERQDQSSDRHDDILGDVSEDVYKRQSEACRMPPWKGR